MTVDVEVNSENKEVSYSSTNRHQVSVRGNKLHSKLTKPTVQMAYGESSEALEIYY